MARLAKMITRGYLIGNIIDSWSSIKEQADIRCKLNLTDLPQYLEDYFCTILNIIREIHLINKNVELSNFQGIDLISNTCHEAWQVTVQKNSSKINSTLEAVKNVGLKDYDIFILIIGSKQSSYLGLSKELCQSVSFDYNEHIWDINDLAKKVVSLPIDRLKQLYDYTKSEEARIKVELQIPTADGDFPTSFQDFVEDIPKPTICGVNRMLEVLSDWTSDYKEEEDSERGRLQDELSSFAHRLKRLPRITREFYAYLLSNLESSEPDLHGRFEVNLDVVKRHASRYEDIDGEIAILSRYKFISVPNPEDRMNQYDSLMLTVFNHGKHSSFLSELIYFVRQEHIDLRRPIVHLDFSAFGDCSFN